MSLCDDFILQSRRTWGLLRKADKVNLSLGEETITDINLIALQSRHPFEITTVKCNKYIEGRLGIDWEWLLLSRGKILALRIQAKKLDHFKLNYPYLGSMHNGKKQIDLLINSSFSAVHNPIPLYVFYNYWKRGTFNPTWTCRTYRKSQTMLGCSIAYAPAIRKLLNAGSNKLVDIAKIMYPWSCLVCCTQGQKRHKDLTTDVLAFVQEVLAREYADQISSQQTIRDEIPLYVSRIIQGETLSDDDWLNAGVKRITLIREL